MSSIFGGSQGHNTSNSYSQNLAYPSLQGPLLGDLNTGNGAMSQIANMLGLNGPQGQNQGFANWRNSTGYQFGLKQGEDAITGNAATQGLLNSGSTLKALDTYGQNYANTQYGNYINQLQGLLGSGLQGAQVLTNAGLHSQTNSQGTTASNNGGIGAFVGDLLTKGGGS